MLYIFSIMDIYYIHITETLEAGKQVANHHGRSNVATALDKVLLDSQQSLHMYMYAYIYVSVLIKEYIYKSHLLRVTIICCLFDKDQSILN
jgi:hypothetical protein